MSILKPIKDPVANTQGRENNSFEIVDIIQTSKSIKRLVFADHTQSLSKSNEGNYVKLIFPKSEGRDALRSFTIAEVEVEAQRFAIDFSSQQPDGLASSWVSQVTIGDSIAINPPKPIALANKNCHWFFLAGDMTALPTLLVMLKSLPQRAKGYVVINVHDASDIQTPIKPEGIEIDWLVETDQTIIPNNMLAYAKAKAWLTGDPFIWVAGEFDMARTLRQYFKQEKHINKNYYFSSYWKYGNTDEGNKRAKKQDGGF